MYIDGKPFKPKDLQKYLSIRVFSYDKENSINLEFYECQLGEIDKNVRSEYKAITTYCLRNSDVIKATIDKGTVIMIGPCMENCVHQSNMK